jgi:4-hydroxy-4-methyl-2-oxoglutarate aldolase
VTTASATVEAPRGEVNVPIACGSVVVNPGDIVVADEDGVVVIPPAAGEWLLDKVEKLIQMFASVQPVLLRGEVTNIAKITSDFVAQGLAIDDGGFREG